MVKLSEKSYYYLKKTAEEYDGFLKCVLSEDDRSVMGQVINELKNQKFIELILDSENNLLIGAYKVTELGYQYIENQENNK